MSAQDGMQLENCTLAASAGGNGEPGAEDSSHVFSPRMTSKATLALKAGEWLRRLGLMLTARLVYKDSAIDPLMPVSKKAKPPLTP
jgi:hypothetical protein